MGMKMLDCLSPTDRFGRPYCSLNRMGNYKILDQFGKKYYRYAVNDCGEYFYLNPLRLTENSCSMNEDQHWVLCNQYLAKIKNMPKKKQYLVGLLHRRGRLIHLLVLMAFRGKCPEGLQTRHINGNPQDNRLSNLEYGTPVENYADRIRHGTDNSGERSSFAKLTETQVIEIRRLYQTGLYTYAELGKMFSVDQSNIYLIVKKINWKHLS